ncbi:MAG: hypothetical protein ACI36W_04040 [Coriobacteriales bacterium]
MRNTASTYKGVGSKVRACALAAALSFLLAGGAVLAQPSAALAVEPPVAEVPAGPAFIGERTALNIALDHAGLKKRQVRDAKVRLGRYNHKKAYVAKFYRKHVKYEYCIRAKNGKILFYSANRV